MREGQIHNVLVPFLKIQEQNMDKKLKINRERKRARGHLFRSIGSWAIRIGIVCFVAFVLVLFFGKRVSNVGDSMNPELSNGDIVLVNTLVYNAKNPARGDVIVFKPQGDKTVHSYMKRVIGLPEETVEIKEGILYINGKELQEDYKTTAIKEAGLASEKIKLKKQEYFVLGDNRLSSIDSRSLEVGNVKKTEIEGQAWFVASPMKHFGFVK